MSSTIIFKIFLLLCTSKCLSEEVWSSPTDEESSEPLFEVTGYPLTGDIPLLNRKIQRLKTAEQGDCMSGCHLKARVKYMYKIIKFRGPFFKKILKSSTIARPYNMIPLIDLSYELRPVIYIILDCIVTYHQIFRGARVNVREHPYVVSIRRNAGHYLTGTLITKNLVLTVAHPIKDVPIQELRVVVGETYSERGTSLLTVIIILIHEDFDPFTLVADICMLRVFEDIIYRSSVKSISLAMPQITLSGTAFVTGWGRCDFTGNELCLPRTSKYYPDEKIDPMLRSISVAITSQNHYCEGYKLHETKIGEGMMCVGGAREENPAYPCLAVPGAPLVINAKLVGILSWGFGCGFLHDLPLIYTSTQHYTRWITRNIVVFGKLTKKDFTQLFEATKSYVILGWMSKTGVSMPEPHGHANVYKELQLMEFDEQLVELEGTPYDIRDFIDESGLRDKKVRLYEEIKKTIIENLTKAENIEKYSKLKLMFIAKPFLSNKSLLDVSATNDESEDSDDD